MERRQAAPDMPRGLAHDPGGGQRGDEVPLEIGRDRGPLGRLVHIGRGVGAKAQTARSAYASSGSSSPGISPHHAEAEVAFQGCA